MITDADVQKLKRAFKDTFTTKEDLRQLRADAKDDLKDLREQIKDDMDGELIHQKDAIVKEIGEYISDTIVPMFDERDKKIARLEKNAGLAPLAG